MHIGQSQDFLMIGGEFREKNCGRHITKVHKCGSTSPGDLIVAGSYNRILKVNANCGSTTKVIAGDSTSSSKQAKTASVRRYWSAVFAKGGLPDVILDVGHLNDCQMTCPRSVGLHLSSSRYSLDNDVHQSKGSVSSG